MDMQIATYDQDLMESGKFYLLHLTKEGAHALVETKLVAPDTKMFFNNSRYLEIGYITEIPPQIEVYETIHDEGGVLKCNLIVISQSIREQGNAKMVSLESSQNFTGFAIVRK